MLIKKEVTYRGEKYLVDTLIEIDEEGNEYTTTESDMEWWKDLRTQYITKHPEVLQEFIDNFPPTQLIEKDSGDWIASEKSPGGKYTLTGEGKSREEALKNLYICLAK